MGTYGVALRTSGPGTWVECRQRGGAVTVGQPVMLDLAGTDGLTSTFVAGTKQNPGTQSAASSPLVTTLYATTALAVGRVGIAMSATGDNQLGHFEFGELGDGRTAPVVVDADVLVDAASTRKAGLRIGAYDGESCLVPTGAGAVYAVLLEDCTTDNGRGPSATVNKRKVLLYSEGLVASESGTDAITQDSVADEAIVRSAIADPAGLTFSRSCAEFRPGIAGSQQLVSFSFDPTNTTDLTIRFKRRGLSLPAASETRRWAGIASSADRPNVVLVNTAGVYTVEMRENASALASYTWTDDLEEHEWTFAYLSTGCTIYLDGVSVATGAAASLLDTSTTFCVGNASTGGTTFLSDHALYRDFEVIDPATSTNKVYLRLDEGAGGPYRNAYLTPGDPLYDATNTSAVTVATGGTMTQYPGARICQTLDGGDRPVVARRAQERTRVAAYSGLGDSTTAGAFGSVSWAPTGTPAFNVEMDVCRSLTQGADVIVFGRSAASYASIALTPAGAIAARVNTTNICTTTAAAIPPDGRVRRIRVEFRDSGADVTAAVYVNGQLVASGTLAATQFSAVADTHYIGSFTSGARRWSGLIYDVLIEDLNSAANSGFYLMDEARGSTTYANSYPTASLAGLTINGFVATCPVVSTDGRGRSWQPGDGGAFRYGARLLADAAGITGVTSQTITGLTEDERDPTGHYAAGVFTAPCAGIATFTCHASIQATTLAGADNVALTVTATSGDVYSAPVTLGAANVYAPICVNGIVSLAAAETLTAAFTSLLVGDVYTIAAGAAFHIDFTPTPAAG